MTSPDRSGSLRTAMPTIAAFIDDLRAAGYGAAVAAALRNAQAGGTDFHAREAGREFGRLPPPPAASYTADQLLAARRPETIKDAR